MGFTENGNFNTGYQNFKQLLLEELNTTNTWTTKNNNNLTTDINNTHTDTQTTNAHYDTLNGMLIAGNKFTDNGNFNTGYQNFKQLLEELNTTNTWTTKNNNNLTTNINNTHTDT